ncbi:MAG: phosphoenolpyruvate carboxylase [Hyphomicrobiales bacterium]
MKFSAFRTAGLDLRQNTTVINRVLQEIWRKLNPLASDAPQPGTAAWGTWLAEELEKPLGFLPQFMNLSEEAAELIGLLGLVRETINGPDHKAIGAFILSMTQSADDVMGLYLLAKLTGNFADPMPARSAASAWCRCLKPSTTCAPRPPSWPTCWPSRWCAPPWQQMAARNHVGLLRQQQGWRLFAASFELFEAVPASIRVA